MGNTCTKRTFKDGKLHSYDDKPISYLLDDVWYDNGLVHRDNGPAVVRFDGMKRYYKHGKPHRELGQPVIEFPDGSEVYMTDEKIHRDGDKPAIILNANNGLFVDDKKKIEYAIFSKHEELYDILINMGLFKINGIIKYWFKKGKLTRDDGPVIETNDYIIWIKDYMIHRDNGPAIIYADGKCEFWTKNVKADLMQQHNYGHSRVKSARN